MSTIEAEILRPINIGGTVRKTGEIVTISQHEFTHFAARENPLVKLAGKPIDRQKYETKTPKPLPTVSEPRGGWFTVTHPDGTTERAKGADKVNEILEGYANAPDA